MPVWTIYDYVELTGRNPIREWLNKQPLGDQAKIDYRLQQMQAMEKWPEKWASKYTGTDELYELRVTGKKGQYRPFFTYFGQKKLVILAGAIEKNDKIPASDIQTAETRLAAIKRDSCHVRPHQFDDEEDLEEDGS